MKYKFIQTHRKHYGLSRLCQVLKVSRSGYHKWIKSKPSRREKSNLYLSIRIKEIFIENRKVYGYRRIEQSLEKEGIKCNHKRVRRLMKIQGLKPNQRKKRRVSTTDSKGNKLIFPNLLQNRVAEAPGEILVSDITYISTTEGWLYLAAVLDLYTREILGYAVDDNMSAELVREALRIALNKIDRKKVKIFHSDRGKQFSAKIVTDLMAANKIMQSMSRKGNCYDNATMESFFHTLKSEWLYLMNTTTKKKTKIRIFDYIETFYNRKRLHSSLNYLSPVEFKKKLKLVAKVC